MDGSDGKNCQDKTKSGFAVWREADFFHLRCGMCGCPTVEVCRLTGNSSGPPLCYLTLAIHFGNSSDTPQRWLTLLFSPHQTSIKTPKWLHHYSSVGCKRLVGWLVWHAGNNSQRHKTLVKGLLRNNKLRNTGLSWATFSPALRVVTFSDTLQFIRLTPEKASALFKRSNKEEKKKSSLKTSAMSRPD